MDRVEDLATVDADDFDFVVLLQKHSALHVADLERWSDRILDTRGVLGIGQTL